MKGDQRVQQVERDIDGLTVAKAPALADERIEPLPVNELGDQVPLRGVGFAGPEDLYHVRVTDLPQRPELAANRLVAGRVAEQLESSLLTLDVVADPVDLGETALVNDLQDLEAVVDDVADSVLSGQGPTWRLQFCWVRSREGLAVAALGVGAGFPARISSRCSRTSAALAERCSGWDARRLKTTCSRAWGRSSRSRGGGEAWRRGMNLGKGSAGGRVPLAHLVDGHSQRVQVGPFIYPCLLPAARGPCSWSPGDGTRRPRWCHRAALRYRNQRGGSCATGRSARSLAAGPNTRCGICGCGRARSRFLPRSAILSSTGSDWPDLRESAMRSLSDPREVTSGHEGHFAFIPPVAHGRDIGVITEVAEDSRFPGIEGLAGGHDGLLVEKASRATRQSRSRSYAR